ncbi:hypothetical protein [Rubinisphaera italica]|uniref:Uncharacterized protein n=1 Tax=Rubinisphaera italica TaxID=2527969 RepID=A0A5C5XM89_9PLAN|nr:hypothetical protein [Rubinisphaera italica]TWT63503.1 hypothetical protein Pan54_42560 [Rubinisphaera italica]HBN77970.1 hypothetical protein [Planctomycetaceae bacterium]|tara:strand:+ start:525 stop:950 length:426 start_codon:yes stop_codon:yes gene_type:complete
MADDRPQKINRDNLLAQDAENQSFNYEEFRMNLQQNIQQLEQRGRSYQHAMYWCMGIFASCFPAVLVIEAFQLTRIFWVPPLWSGIGIVSLLAAIWFSGIYSYKYRPALKKARHDMLWTMIAQLQSQVAEIQSRLEKKEDR